LLLPSVNIDATTVKASSVSAYSWRLQQTISGTAGPLDLSGAQGLVMQYNKPISVEVSCPVCLSGAAIQEPPMAGMAGMGIS
jgi:hypothetical protein